MRQKEIVSRSLATILCLCMLLGMAPISAFAYDKNFASETHTVFKHTESTIAPGVEQYINYAYASDGKQMVYYVATADISRDDVVVQSAYKDAQCTNFGMDKLTNQMAAANAKYSDPNNAAFISEYYTAVAGTNADFYNMTTGQPSGAFVMDGVVRSNKANNRPWFAVFADGTALCGANNADWDAAVAAHGAVQQAVGGSQVLLKDGKDITASASGSYNTDRHSRTMVGVTADGKVVMAVLDGRQEPFSCGGTMHELAQIMLEAGCVSAINLDGGGSTTFVSRPEGSDKVQVINRPSDGSERSISSGLIIASTAAPSNVFDRAVLTVENEYVTPGSAVKVSAVGVSPAGTAAEIPADVTYTAALGTIDADGTFVSDGSVGDAAIQMVYGGKVVGETVVHVVVPDEIRFNQEKITVPLGKTVKLAMTATYGLNEVVMKDGDVNFTLDDASIGTIEGVMFTASDHAASSAITAVCAFDANVTASASIALGKGSEVVLDFEDGATGFGVSDGGYNYYLGNHSAYNVTAETGMVHSGDCALAVNMDFSNSLESGYQRLSLYWDNETKAFEGATKLGMWIYVPDECISLWARWMNVDIGTINEDGSYKVGGLTAEVVDGVPNSKSGWVYERMEESGWHYFSIDLSGAKGAILRNGYYCVQFYISDRAGSDGYLGLKDAGSGEYANVNGNYTFYIDDVTVDYSDAVDDREAPVFSELNYGTTAMADAVAIAKWSVPTIAYNEIDFAAKVADVAKDNATGLDAASARAYVDGSEVSCTYANGVIAMDRSAALTDGVHTIKFAICDKQGNYASIIRQVNIQTGSGDQSVKIVAHDPNADRIPFGSVQYIDVVAAHVEDIESVTAVIDLDSMSKWELDHMVVANGFSADWSMSGADEAENIATLTITRTGSSALEGEAVLVSIPVRAWELKEFQVVNGKTWNYAAFKAGKESWPVAIDLKVDMGEAVYTNGETESFTGEGVRIWTEMWGSYAYMTMTAEGQTYWKNWNGGHIHNAVVLEDKVATCTEAGYTGRTFCEACNSVVKWGTTVPATGHSYAFDEENVLKCTVCGELFTGIWEDGKEYVDGILAVDGWKDDSYYVNGVKLTGVKEVEGFYYDFGEDGVCEGKVKYTGLFFDETASAYRYSQLGVVSSGWKQIDDEWYFFDASTLAAIESLNNGYVTYEFEETGRLVDGVWFNDGAGTKYYYGPGYYKNVGVSRHTWVTIHEDRYAFDNDGHRLEGACGVMGSNEKKPTFYYFDENGACQGLYTGIAIFDGKTFFSVDGELQYGGLFKHDGAYYYVDDGSGYVVMGRSCYCYTVNGLLPRGTYTFNAEGKMVDAEGNVIDPDAPAAEPEKKNGIINGYYYVDDVMQFCGLIKYEGAYYYVDHNYGKIIKDQSYYCYVVNGLLPRGTYTFNAEGKMVDSEGNVIVL